MADPSWGNVLILQTSFLGDTVLTLPLIDEIRRHFPVKRLTLLCQPASRELLHDHPGIDEIIVDDKKKADRGFAGLRAKARALQAQGFTVALTPHKSLRSGLMLYWAKIPCRVGFRQSKSWFLFHLLSHTAEIPVFFICSLIDNSVHLKNPFKDWQRIKGFTGNVFKLWSLFPGIYKNKPHFYKMF